MTEQLQPQPTDRVLEIGTGSGYQSTGGKQASLL
jgi:protein-L-isoaspartate O-methyltransferase